MVPSEFQIQLGYPENQQRLHFKLLSTPQPPTSLQCLNIGGKCLLSHNVTVKKWIYQLKGRYVIRWTVSSPQDFLLYVGITKEETCITKTKQTNKPPQYFLSFNTVPKVFSPCADQAQKGSELFHIIQPRQNSSIKGGDKFALRKRFMWKWPRIQICVDI